MKNLLLTLVFIFSSSMGSMAQAVGPFFVASGDGLWVMVANPDERSLVLLDANRNWVRSYDTVTADGKSSSQVAAVHDAKARKSFIVAFKDIAELWEISYNPQAEPIYDGLVHDYRNSEAISKPGFLGVRRTLLDTPLEDFFFDPDGRYVVGLARLKDDTGPVVQVVNLDIRRRMATLALSGRPHPGAATTLTLNGTVVLAIPNLELGVVHLIDVSNWTLIKNPP